MDLRSYIFRLDETTKLNLNSFINLKGHGLHVCDYDDLNKFPIDLQSTAKSLVNLERLYFSHIKSEIIEPFIRYSAVLKAIKIHLFREKIIYLSSLNRKREHLVGAKKVIIYLREDVYLATKWGNNPTNFNMIEVRREESVEWHVPFSI